MARNNRPNKNRKYKQNNWQLIDEDNFNNERSDRKRVREYLTDEELKTINKRITKEVILTPRGENQKSYVENLLNPNIFITFGIGPAGSGKTLLATQVAIKLLLENKIDKIIITRPAVTADEEIGFLPGNIQKKLEPYLMPILDIFAESYSQKEIQNLINEKKICIEPLAFLRGRTFKNSFIVGDEMQNCTPSQMKMLLTRLGENSRMAITGDLKQHDRKFGENGLLDFTKRLEATNNDSIKVCEFNNNDIQRHPVIDTILKLYNDIDNPS